MIANAEGSASSGTKLCVIATVTFDAASSFWRRFSFFRSVRLATQAWRSARSVDVSSESSLDEEDPADSEEEEEEEPPSSSELLFVMVLSTACHQPCGT